MKQISLILFFVITLASCEKDSKKVSEDVPNYKPGRLTKIINKDNINKGEPYHTYEYKENEVIDKYYSFNSGVLSPDILTTKYHFNNDHLEKVFYSLEGANHYYQDSLIYIYSESQIIEYTYYPNDSPYKRVYFLQNGEIKYSIEKDYGEPSRPRIDSTFYTWSGENLVGIEAHNWFYRTSPLITKYEFQYTTIENPLFYSNIPSIYIQNNYTLSGIVIQNCSRNFPASLSISNNDVYFLDSNSFESKKFQNFNIPYEVSLSKTNSYTIGVYSFIYEEL